MPKPTTIYYTLGQKLSGVFMVLALLWLTVSTPFVYANQQQQEILGFLECDGPEEECGNPFSNTTEEKTEGGVNTLSEYLHAIEAHTHHFIIVTQQFKGHFDDLYFAFHPELVSPPPEA